MASITKRETATGKARWTARVYIGRDPKTGKRKFLIETFDTKTEATAWAGEREGKKGKGKLTATSRERLGKYLEKWLDAKEGEVRARTIHDYRGIVGRYILDPPAGAPSLALFQLKRLTAENFEALYTFMWKEKELSPRTIQYLHTILRQALGDAVKRGALAANPTDYVKRPTRDRDTDEPDPAQKKVRAMSEAEAGQFIEAARSDRYHPLWVLLITSGLRPGEALGLRWDAVDLDGGRIRVEQALTRTGVDGWKLVEPKTKKARRSIPLPALAIQALREWKATQAKERLRLGAEYENHSFVFATEFGKPLDQANIYQRNFRRVMEGAKLGEWEEVRIGRRVKKKVRRFRPAFTMYDLRHTCATLLLAKGVNPKIVQERLGHSQITLTLDTYSHVLPTMQDRAVEALESVFAAGA